MVQVNAFLSLSSYLLPDLDGAAPKIQFQKYFEKLRLPLAVNSIKSVTSSQSFL